MGWMFLTVVCATWLVLSFKVFEKYKLDIFQVIVYNYITCVATNWVTEGHFPFDMAFLGSGKSWYALGLGLFFVLSFNFVGLTVSRISVTIASILQKMTIIVTTAFAYLMYDESMGILKVAGIFLAIGAIFLTNIPGKKESETSVKKFNAFNTWILPIGTFITCCIVDLGIIYASKTISGGKTDPQMISALFAGAGVFGITGLIAGLLTKKMKFDYRCIVAGILLGIPNYGTLYFITRSFSSGLDISLVFPVVNMATICLAALSALIFFRERLSIINWAGVTLALVSIAMISFA